MKASRSSWLAVGVGLLAIAGPAAQAQNVPTVRFVLDWKFEGQQSMFTVPLDDGTYRKLGLNVVVDRGSGSGDTVAKVAGGAYDIGFADTYTMVRFNAANPNNQLISVAMGQDISAAGVAALRSAGITKPTDLQGKKIYAPASDAGRQLFPIFAHLNNIDPNSILWNTVSSDMRDTMLYQKQADAVTGNLTTVVMDMYAFKVPESELQLFYYSRFGIALYGNSIVTTRAFAEKNPEAVRNVIRGIVHGLNVMIKDPNAALASVKSHDPLLNNEVEKTRLNRTLQDSLITPHVLDHGFSNVDMARLEETLKQVAPAFGIAAPSAKDVYTDRFLPPAAELKVLPWHPGQNK
jgi:NitT/TauT family transport system substrate-binding protein